MLGASASAVASDAPAVEVGWSGPAECSDTELVEATQRLLASSSVVGPVRIDARVDSGPAGFRLDVEFEAGVGASGHRSFEAASCRTVSRAAALAIAIAVDPRVLDRMLEQVESEASPSEPPPPEPVESEVVPELEFVVPDPAGPPRREPSPSSPPPEPRGATDAPQSPARWRAVVGVAGVLDGGALPGPGGGIAAVVGAQRGLLRVEAVGSYRFATSRSVAAVDGVGGSFSQWSAGGRGCVVPGWRRLETPVCAGLDGGQTRARGTGIRSAPVRARPWIAGVLAAGVAWRIVDRVALTARGSVAVPWVLHEFRVENAGLVHRTGRVQGRALLGVELRIP